MSEAKPRKNRLVEAFKKRLEELKEVKGGTWFTSLLRRLLEENSKSGIGEYFKKKYPALNPERIAQRLIRTSSHAAGLSGAAAAAAVTAAELGAVETGGAALAVGVGAFVAEVSATTYIQLRMVYNISVVFDAPFDLNDPEDLMAIFWYAFGVNKWEDAANAFLKSGPRAAEYLGRKALRSGVRRFLQQIAGKLGGQQLARKITERALLKLIVPGVNMPIAYAANLWFTKKLGRIVVKHVKIRAAAIRPMKKLKNASRKLQLTGLAVVYQIGIQDEDPAVDSRVVEMLDVVTRTLDIREEEVFELEELIAMPMDQFLRTLNGAKDEFVVDPLIEIASISHLLSKASKASRLKLNALASCLGQTVEEGHLAELKRELAV
jgi:hypothetical protein